MGNLTKVDIRLIMFGKNRLTGNWDLFDGYCNSFSIIHLLNDK